MDDYLTKPVVLPRLKATLERHLAAAHAEPLQPAPDVAPPAAPALDIRVLQELVGDDDDVVDDFLIDYLASAREQALALRSACATGGLEEIRAIAHRLKSSSRSVGARALGELCAELEEAAVMPTLARFEQELAAVEACVADRLDRRASRTGHEGTAE
jgi:HPt (histidine-containing phosphotransfer) domain-containing protein